MFECYADGWDGKTYQHIIIYLNAPLAQCRDEVAEEFKEVYGTDCEFVMCIPVGMNRECV